MIALKTPGPVVVIPRLHDSGALFNVKRNLHYLG